MPFGIRQRQINTRRVADSQLADILEIQLADGRAEPSGQLADGRA